MASQQRQSEPRRDSGYPAAGRAWLSMGVLTLLYAVSLLDRQVIALLVPNIRADLGISDFQIGLVSGLAFALFYATFGLLFGWAADRMPRRGIIFLGVTVWSLAAAGCGLVRNFAELALARFGLGAGEAALNPSAYSIIADSFPRHRLSFAISVFQTGAQIGAVLSLVIGGVVITLIPAEGMTVPLLGHLAGWRIVFLLVGLPGLLFALLIWTIKEPPRLNRLSAKGASLAETMAFMRRNLRLFGCHFAGFGLLVAVTYGWQAWTPTYLMRKFDMPVSQIATLVAVTALPAGLLGTIATGLIVDRLFAAGRRTVHLSLSVVLAIVQLLAIVVAIWTDSIVVYFAMHFIVLLMTGFTGAAIAALQLVTPNDYRGQVSAGFLFSFNLLGMGVGPTLAGFMTTHVFADDAMVGWSMAGSALILAPLAVLCLMAARPAMDRALRDAEAWSGDPAD